MFFKLIIYLGYGFIGLVILGAMAFVLLGFLAEMYNCLCPPRGKEHRLPAPPPPPRPRG